jgi:hypothetical protein
LFLLDDLQVQQFGFLLVGHVVLSQNFVAELLDHFVLPGHIELRLLQLDGLLLFSLEFLLLFREVGFHLLYFLDFAVVVLVVLFLFFLVSDLLAVLVVLALLLVPQILSGLFYVPVQFAYLLFQLLLGLFERVLLDLGLVQLVLLLVVVALLAGVSRFDLSYLLPQIVDSAVYF